MLVSDKKGVVAKVKLQEVFNPQNLLYIWKTKTHVASSF